MQWKQQTVETFLSGSSLAQRPNRFASYPSLSKSYRIDCFLLLQGLAKGTTIPSIGSVTITWFTGHSSASNGVPSATAKSTPPSSTTPAPVEDKFSVPPPSEDDVTHDEGVGMGEDEEAVTSRWGADEGEDGFGMM